MLLAIKWLFVVVTVVLSSSEAFRIPNLLGYASRQDPSVREVCNSSICQQDATEILESLDKSVDPCDDFYMFTCGGWMEKHPATKATPFQGHYIGSLPNVLAQIQITLEEPISEDDIRPLKAAKKMYQVCMDVETIERAGIQPLVDISNEFSWPMALEDWNEEDFSLETALAEYDRRLHKSPFFYTSVGTFKANNSLILKINIQGPDIGLSRSELLDPWEKETRDTYKHLIANVSLEILNALNVRKTAESVLLHATEIVEFMINLQNISLEYATDNEIIRIKELQKWTNSYVAVNAHAQFNWLTYLKKILSDTPIVVDENVTTVDESFWGRLNDSWRGDSTELSSTTQVLNEFEEVIVDDTDYLLKLFKLLDNTPRRVIANYLHWRIIDTLKGATTKRMQELTLHYKNETRSTYCSGKTQERFSHALNSKIAPNMFNKNVEDESRYLLESIRSEYETQIANIDWLDDVERSLLTERLKSLNSFIGYPKYLYNNASALEEFYKQVNVSDKHFNNMMILTKNEHMRSVRRLRDRVNWKDDLWFTSTPEWPTAFFAHSESAMVVMFGLLQPFFFNQDRLKSLNYGRIGETVGHEMMHGITEFKYDWSNVTEANIATRHQCFIDQFNKYHFPELEEHAGGNVTVNGTITLFENIADTTGIYMAYKAYQTEMKNHSLELSLPGLEEYSPDQMFFIGFGTAECDSITSENLEMYVKDSHAPHYVRVRGTVSNIKEFATAFNCPAGSNMNPVNKCRMW